MNTDHKPMTSKQMDRRLNKVEAGYTVTIQAVYYTVLLFVFFALIYDIGNAGFVATIANNAARLAAQDAAKNIDPQAFIDNQEIRLSADALTRAQDMVDGITNGKLTLSSVAIRRQSTRDVIEVRGDAVADMPVLGSLFGLQSVTIPVEAYAEPAYGISEEGQ
jgi:hypothetical protein